MYGLFTKLGLGAVVSAGLSVLGISYLCTDAPSNHEQAPAAVVAIQADAALGAGVTTAPSSHSPGQGGGPAYGSPGNQTPGATNPGSSANNPGSNPSQPGVNHATVPACNGVSANPRWVRVCTRPSPETT